MKTFIVFLLPLAAFGQCDFSGKNYNATLQPGQFQPICRFSFVNHGKGIMAGIQIDTDSDNVDSAAAVRIDNAGRSDAIYIGLRGKWNQASRPTGIGIDMNRGPGDHENSSGMNGFGVQIWDWSEHDQGLNGPAALYIQKVHNLNTGHRAIWILSNRSAITLETRNAPDPSAALLDVTDGKFQRAAIFADGSMQLGGGAVIHSTSKLAQYVGSTSGSQPLKVISARHCYAEATSQDAARSSHWITVDGDLVTVHGTGSFDVFCTF